MKLEFIEIVEDRTARSRCDEGFLRVARLVLRNHYDDGSRSRDYPCDVVSRPGSDAVVAVLYEITADRRVRVLLRDSPRPPVYLRRFKRFEHHDARIYRTMREVVAGIVETGDGGGDAGLRRRAAIEATEEAGARVSADDFAVLGCESFASPGTSDEKIFFTACAIDISAVSRPKGEGRAIPEGDGSVMPPGDGSVMPPGDGSVMEECAELVAMELGEAIEACRSGGIPDMKTELALWRLADHLGFLPQLNCFADELPRELAGRHRPLAARAAPGAHQ